MTLPYSKIGIIGAMDVEVETLKDQMKLAGDVVETSRIGMSFFEGELGCHDVVVVKCGVGMVNAATCTQTLISEFECDAVINTGVAGSLDPRIEIGDIVIGTDAVNHVMDVENLGYAPGQTPDLETRFFPTDEALGRAIEHAASELGIEAHTGRVASGDRFVRDADDKKRIVDLFEARCCEMEGAAIAQVCWLGQIPCALVRAISDKADGSASVDYPTFERKAAHNCASLVLEVLK